MKTNDKIEHMILDTEISLFEEDIPMNQPLQEKEETLTNEEVTILGNRITAEIEEIHMR